VDAALDELAEELENNGDEAQTVAASLPSSTPRPPATPLGPARRPPGRVTPQRGAARGLASTGGSREDTPVVLRCEQLAEEWHFDEASHALGVDQLRSHCRALKEREAAARKRAQLAEEQAEDEIQKVLRGAEEGEVQRARQLAGLRSELVEVQHREEQLREDCQHQLAAVQRKIEAERDRRRRLEEALREEPRRAAEAARHLQEVQDAEYEQLRHKDNQLRTHRAAAQREVLEVQRAAEQQVRDVEQRMHLDLAVMQRELDELLQQAQYSVQCTVQDRRHVHATAEGDVRTVDRQVLQGLTATHREAQRLQDDAVEQVKEVQARDFALESLLHKHTGEALASLGCSAEEKRQAALLEHEHRQRNAAAVKALGETFPRSTQYQLHLDKKTRSAVLAASAYAVVAGPSAGDGVPVGATPWQTRTRLQAGDEGRSYQDVLAELAAST